MGRSGLRRWFTDIPGARPWFVECSGFPKNVDNPPNWDSGCSQRAALENRKRDFLHEVSLLFHRQRFGHRERNRNSRKSETTYGQFDDLLPEIRRRKASL